MVEIVTAVYEKGVLRPLQPLKLRERQTVLIQVMPDERTMHEEPAGEVEQVIQGLISAGLMHPRPKGTPPPDPVSEQERRRLADIMGKAPGKPLSEIIIKERGEW